MILLPLFFAIAALGVPDSAAVSSANAVYDGNTLVLTGHVLLDHGLGKMAADEARLERQENGKDFPFSLIQLVRNVQMNLKNGAAIECADAQLDFIQLKGLLSSSEGGKVVYNDSIKKGLLRLLGNTVELKFAKKEGGEQKDFDIDAILAKEEVLIEFASKFALTADRALYRKAPPQEGASPREFQGVITAYPKDSSHPCHLTHEGDLIDAETVDLDLINSRLSLLRPKGTLTSLLVPGMQKGEIKFSSDHLLWDDLKNALTLKGHVQIIDSLFGMLATDGELEIVKTQQKLLKTIRSRGMCVLDFKDEAGSLHHLVGHGPFLFDRERLRATFESPKRDGAIPADKQLFYKTDTLSLYANQALLEYTAQESHLKPTVLTVVGNVRLFSSDEKDRRFALADRLSLSTTTRTVILTADPGKKVLFIDEAQGMRIAASEIHITRDPKTEQEKVQGIGSVRFTFTDEEFSLFKKIFPHYNPAESL